MIGMCASVWCHIQVWVNVGNKACLWSASRRKRGPMTRYRRKCMARTGKKRCAREHVCMYAYRVLYIFNEVVPWIFEEIFPVFSPLCQRFPSPVQVCHVCAQCSLHYLLEPRQNQRSVYAYINYRLCNMHNELLEMTRGSSFFFVSTFPDMYNHVASFAKGTRTANGFDEVNPCFQEW